MLWLHRRSEDEAEEIPDVSNGRTMNIAAICGESPPILRPKSSSFFCRVSQHMTCKNGVLGLYKSIDYEELSVHQAVLKFMIDVDNRNAETFINYMRNTISDEVCHAAERFTRDQRKSKLWYELRYGRISASQIHEAAYCKKSTESLSKSVLETAGPLDAAHVLKRQKLKHTVLQRVEKLMNIKIEMTGLFLKKAYPVFSVSPDGVSQEHVVEVKCLSDIKDTGTYLTATNTPTPKFDAQMQLQMFLCNKKKGLLCVVYPKFEENQEMVIIELELNPGKCQELANFAEDFWKKSIFVLLDT